ncbi:hypothetical protein HZ994_11475 [Akkermansiaceae bacterium]|nr:hypothetical protein HZ994_11475 [Akkermansiaceae bacterium]
MKQIRQFAWLLSFGLWAANVSAYEVWMGTHLMRSSDASNLSEWSLAASQMDGININRAPNDTEPASNNDWRTIFKQFSNRKHSMSEVARSEVTRNPVSVDELAYDDIDQRLSEIFGFENTFGYDLDILMFYNERGTYRGVEYLYEWTQKEVQHMREWLDTNGRADVRLMWNVRNNSVENQNWAKNPLVDLVEIESSTTAFLANTNNQITFFTWFWNNSVTKNKEIALQMPRVLPGDPLDQFQGSRRVAKKVGDIIGYGEDGMRSNRLIFMPVTYNDNYLYRPETVSNGTSYTDTMTSICLSLIEQRQLFEGRLPQLPTNALADSKVRTIPPTITAIANRTTNENTQTPAIAFTVADGDTALTALTVSATSSNPVLTPASGFVFGGSGKNRTVKVTPAPGQMGTSVITVTVSDGYWSASSSFTLSVGTTLASGSTDAAITDAPAVTDQTATTVLLGSGGNSPYTERCAVYAFQLPSLGNVANPFKSSSFTFNLEDKQGTLTNNDLYGLGRRDTGTVLVTDYYGKTATADPTDATRLQTNILTNGTPLGLVSTSAAGNTALLSYLNAQYASGAGAGKYVFLRLNTTGPKTGINRATITMSEGGETSPTDTRPRLFFTTNSAPTIASIGNVTTNQSTATSTIPFTIGDVESTANSLTVTATSSNTALIPNASIVLGGSGTNRTFRITPTAGATGSSIITIQVSDGVRTTSTTFTINVFNAILGELADAEIAPNQSTAPFTYGIQNLSWTSLSAGTSGGNVGRDRSVVFPFLLPSLGSISNPFSAVSFSANLESLDNSPLGNVRIYGLGKRDTATVLTTDYYAATSTLDTTDATLIQTNFIPSGTTGTGLKNTDNAGDAKLIAYLNAQYAGGAGAGKYVFLRLATDTPQTGGSSRFRFTSADGAVAASNAAIRPQIGYLAASGNLPPTISSIGNRSIPVDTSSGEIPFTIGDSQTSPASLILTQSSSNTALVPEENIVFGGSGAERTVSITPVANQVGDSTITITVSDGVLTSSTTFSLSVFRALFSEQSDAEVQFTLSTPPYAIQGLSNINLFIGTAGGTVGKERCPVFPFQLPNLGIINNPFTAAAFTINFESKDSNPVGNVSVYGLGRRDAGTVSFDDYWTATSDTDSTDATLLQTNLIPAGSSDFGLKTTNTAANATLIAYLNAQYAGGAGAGKYVFLRLSSDAPQTGGASRYKVTSADGAAIAENNAIWPQIAYTATSGNFPPTISEITSHDIAIGTDTGSIPFTIADGQSTPESLALSATSSNPALIPAGNITFAGTGANRTVTVSPVAGQLGSSTIIVTVSDGALTASSTFTINVLPALFGALSDAEIQPNETTPPLTYNILNLSGSTLVIGTAGGNTGRDRCAVFPFQLPNLGTIDNPFTTVEFTVNFNSKDSNPLGNVSVYGLGSRSANTVLDFDHWAATTDVDPTDATLLQTNLIPAGSSDFGLKTTDENGSANLLAYLNAQYAGGAGAGKYVFLRLASDTPQTGGTSRYRVTSADGALAVTNNTLWPRLTYSAIIQTPPTISDITDRSINVNTETGAIPFTVGDGQTEPGLLTLSKSSSNPSLVPTANIVFDGTDEDRTVTVTPAANQLGSSTITITVSDGTLTTSDTFVVTVIGNGIETWRFNHFGTTADTGTAADSFDANNDGENNLLEYATGQSPMANTTASTPISKNGASLEFTYTRSKAAIADGVTFQVEWSDTLAPNSWDNTGVTEGLPTDNGTTQTVKATMPAGTSGKRFAHLKVTR